MRLARFGYQNTARFGVVDTEHVVAMDHRVERFADLLADTASARVRADDPRIALDRVSWLPPFCDDAKIMCVGFNYKSHDGEGDRRAGEYPTLFVRFPDSFIGSGGCVQREADSHTLDWEGEVAIVIGRAGRRIPADSAWDHIAGLTAMAENSERVWQIHSNQGTAGKNWTASGACGPWVTTLDEVGREPVELTTRLNGAVVQHDSTANLTFDFPALVSYISTFTALRPGDVIATGTPAGVGYRRDPPRYLTPGDDLEVSVSRVGTLRHGVTDGPAAPVNPGRSPRSAYQPAGGSS
jgi:2-keto-4-pentenoate hydratase/2-oxohepta-3-ene-1,7-dioic acid hydratase in catechol pathway